jgi:hypothetical protein
MRGINHVIIFTKQDQVLIKIEVSQSCLLIRNLILFCLLSYQNILISLIRLLFTNISDCGICSNPHNTRNCSQRTTPKCPACLGPHPVFDRKRRLHLRHSAMNGELETSGGITRSRDEGASNQRPTFGPTLPPGMARERREASINADANMTDA